jgi:hypothetical protein
MRQKRFASAPGPGFDSMVDVLSNMVGALLLLCILTALEAGSLKWELFISRERLAGTTPVAFMLRDGVVRQFDVDYFGQAMAAADKDTALLRASREFEFDAVVHAKPEGGMRVELRDSAGFTGVPIGELLAGGGPIHQQLTALDGRQNHVYFYLAPDAFEHYVPLRRHCEKLGLKVGWSPVTSLPEFTSGSGTGSGVVPATFRVEY